MKKIFLIIVLLTIFFDLWSYFILPVKVVSRFTIGGRPAAWTSKEVNCCAFLFLHILLFLLFWNLPFLITKIPTQWVNLPNRSFWLAQENKPLTRKKFEALMAEFGSALFVFMFFVSFLTVKANRSEPVKLNESQLLQGLVVFLLFIGYWVIKVYKSFRLPISSKE